MVGGKNYVTQNNVYISRSLRYDTFKRTRRKKKNKLNGYNIIIFSLHR